MKKILGILASPRKGSNSKILLEHFLEEAPSNADVILVNVFDKRISPCNACGCCEEKGNCVIRDDMDELYHLIDEADFIVVASPVYFYGPPAPLKALIDRCQVFWVRKYLFKEELKLKKGVLINVSAREGVNTFVPFYYITKVWFNSINAEFSVHIKVGGFEKEKSVEEREIIDKVRNYGKTFFKQT